MAVYDLRDRQNNNIWWGGGRGGILDLLGQYLLQPMIMREMAAKQYDYDTRLANQKHNLDLQMKNAEWDRRDYEANRFIEAYNRDPRRAVGGGEMLAFLPGLGYNGNASDVAAWALPQMMTIDQGDQKTVAPVYSGGFIGNGETYDMGLSPQEAGTLALAQRKAAFDEQMARDKNAREWYVARNTVRGGGKAADPYAGINAAANLFESISKFNPGGSGGAGSLNIPGMEGLGGGTQQPPIDMSETLSLANRLVTEELNHRYGPAPGNGLTFEDMLALNGGAFGGSPMLSDFNNGLPPEAGMEDTATITSQTAAAQQQSAGAPSFRERLRDWRTGDAPVAVPGTPQASAKKPFVSAAAVANYAKQFGISEEAARDELTRFNSM